MAWTLEVDPVLRLVSVEVTGSLAYQEFLEATQALAEHPNFSPDFRQLVVYGEGVTSEITSDQLRRLARRPALFSKSSKRAIVVRGDLGFGMARMFELLRNEEAGEIQVFRDVGQARSWLELD